MVGCLRDCTVAAVACAHASCPRGVGEAPRQRPMEGTTSTKVMVGMTSTSRQRLVNHVLGNLVRLHYPGVVTLPNRGH
jgi:hypothetical protein